MQQYAKNISTENNANVWTMGGWWRRKYGGFGGEVEPMWEASHEKVEQRAAVQLSLADDPYIKIMQ